MSLAQAFLARLPFTLSKLALQYYGN